MAKAIALFTGGFTEQRQIAVRDDGRVFYRTKTQDSRYGWRWTKWRGTEFGSPCIDPQSVAGIETMSLGFADLRRASPTDSYINNRAWFNADGSIRVRLPG